MTDPRSRRDVLRCAALAALTAVLPRFASAEPAK
jgi:hypothetical protein